ncbi:hypothetical protein D3C85_1564330 [compost metagenome]
MADQTAQQPLALVEQSGLVEVSLQQFGQGADEVTQALVAQDLAHGSGSLTVSFTLAKPLNILKIQNMHKLICKYCIYSVVVML